MTAIYGVEFVIKFYKFYMWICKKKLHYTSTKINKSNEKR
jgi:hypothetical protein